MLYDLSRLLATAVREKGCPLPVVFAFGREPTESIGATRERIVFEQPTDDRADCYETSLQGHSNPKTPARRLQAARVRVFARSSASGAMAHEHARRAEKIVDLVISELIAIVRARRNLIVLGSGGFVTLPDAAGSGQFAGAVYEFELTIDRAIESRAWDGGALDEVTIGEDVAIVNTTKISTNLGAAGTPPEDAEIAAGG